MFCYSCNDWRMIWVELTYILRFKIWSLSTKLMARGLEIFMCCAVAEREAAVLSWDWTVQPTTLTRLYYCSSLHSGHYCFVFAFTTFIEYISSFLFIALLDWTDWKKYFSLESPQPDPTSTQADQSVLWLMYLTTFLKGSILFNIAHLVWKQKQKQPLP